MSKREQKLVVILSVSLCLHVILVGAWWIWPAPSPIADAPPEKPLTRVWHTKEMAIGDTGYTAFVGPWIFEQDKEQRPIRYSLSVDKPTPTGSTPLYYIDLRIDELPADFLSKPIADIVVYDSKTRLVSFMIGEGQYAYKLPSQ